ncbi:hypothetical protein [Couchioplanes azureus]|uniref:hypothetical protein n=1 Tax=Couchioplanes caeruleus TaxID=56438 RepID=UPI00166F9BDA|nr:hypothetical protein [Couchioplanes caeruleus]GGQ70718.1 hypothetical protein GCM10010166_45900 [Couchioplanes caeruleus subsp. azureus]
MTTIDLFVDDSDIDVAIDDRDEGERRALELAHRIRVVAARDPGQAQRLVDELIVQLDRVLGGTFREYLDGVTREVADRALRAAGSESSADFPSPANS